MGAGGSRRGEGGYVNMSDAHVFRLTGYALTAELKLSFKEASATLKRLRRRRKKVVRAVDAGGLTSWLAEAFFQHSLYRIVALADGAIGEWNAVRPTNAIIIVRSLFEAVASWNYVGGKILRLAKQENMADIHQILLRMRFGLRHKFAAEDNQFPTSTNVLTFVASLEKADTLVENMEAFAPHPNGHKVFRYIYDEMSEFVHPNEAGIGVFGADIDQAAMELNLSESQPATERMVTSKMAHMASLLELADKFFDIYETTIRAAILSLEAKRGPFPGSPSTP
jgi:hypothetical protein